MFYLVFLNFICHCFICRVNTVQLFATGFFVVFNIIISYELILKVLDYLDIFVVYIEWDGQQK